MNEREIAAIMRGVTPLLREHFDALAGRMARDAEQAQALRAAEHRAFMAEQREAAADRKRDHDEAMRILNERIAAVRDGRDGQDGVPGLNGRDGIDGMNGRDGAPGERGERGPAGEPGPAGERGADGAAGTDGRDGLDGAPGAEGAPGKEGRDGIDGRDGAAGADGLNGQDGAAGADGAPGRDGIDGRDGAPGANGRDGQDAYHGQARGLFNPDVTYRVMDVVSLNGSEWRAKQDDPGPLPGPGWMLGASRGKRGEKGDRGDPGRDGLPGQTIVAHYVEGRHLVVTMSDGTEIKTDLAEIARNLRED